MAASDGPTPENVTSLRFVDGMPGVQLENGVLQTVWEYSVGILPVEVPAPFRWNSSLPGKLEEGAILI
jgi:hypothetical protein